MPSAYRRVRDAKRIASAIERSKVSAFPAVLELTLKVSSRVRQDRLVGLIAKWMSQCLDCDAARYLTSGVGDVGDSMLFSKIEMINISAVEHSIVHFLYRFVLGTPLLADRVDRLHRILLHKRAVVSNIAKSFGLPKPLKLGRELGVLAIPKALVEDPTAELRISKFAIPKDKSTSWAAMIEREKT